jgi:hypothetical protein
VKPGSPTALKAAATVVAHPGCDVHELAHLTGWTVRHCSKALTGAKLGGLIDISRAGNTARWYPAEQIAAIREAQRQERNKREYRLQKLRIERRRIEQIEREADESGTSLDDAPVRRIVGVSEPLPFRVTAANSVWTWRPAA